MNKHDYDNLQFLLHADDATMKEWYKTVSMDDVEYALELLAAYRLELEMRELELTDDVDDVSEAAMVLRGIMAK